MPARPDSLWAVTSLVQHWDWIHIWEFALSDAFIVLSVFTELEILPNLDFSDFSKLRFHHLLTLGSWEEGLGSVPTRLDQMGLSIHVGIHQSIIISLHIIFDHVVRFPQAEIWMVGKSLIFIRSSLLGRVCGVMRRGGLLLLTGLSLNLLEFFHIFDELRFLLSVLAVVGLAKVLVDLLHFGIWDEVALHDFIQSLFSELFLHLRVTTLIKIGLIFFKLAKSILFSLK